APAVFLGDVHAEETGPPGLVPQLGQRLAAARPRQDVIDVPVLRGEARDGLAQRLLLVGLDESRSHRASSCPPPPASAAPATSAPSPAPATTARTIPTSTWPPAATFSSVSTPSAGAAMVCSIFIASSHRIG